jgi:hypothetical protein
MTDRRLSNARIQGWLADDLDRVAEQTGSSKVLVNSAAVWWFCCQLPAEERARVLGEFVTAQAMRGGGPAAAAVPSTDSQPRGRRARGRPKAT